MATTRVKIIITHSVISNATELTWNGKFGSCPICLPLMVENTRGHFKLFIFQRLTTWKQLSFSLWIFIFEKLPPNLRPFILLFNQSNHTYLDRWEMFFGNHQQAQKHSVNWTTHGRSLVSKDFSSLITLPGSKLQEPQGVSFNLSWHHFLLVCWA